MVGTWVEGGARNVKGRGFGNVVCYCTMRGNRFAGLVKGGGMYLHMQLSPDFWYGQPKRLASGETTAASFALRCELIEVRLPLCPLATAHTSRKHATNISLPCARLHKAESGRIQAPLQLR
jgi:hypothetical protein